MKSRPYANRFGGKRSGKALDELSQVAFLDGKEVIGWFADWDPDLFHLIDERTEAAYVAHARDDYGVELLGRSHNGLCYFGAPAVWPTAKTVSEHPIVLFDNDVMDPKVTAKSLADYLSLIAYSPAVWGDSPASWREAAKTSHERGDDVENLRAFLLSISGVDLPKEPWKLQEMLPVVDLSEREPPLEEEEEPKTKTKTKAARPRTINLNAFVPELWKKAELAKQSLVLFRGLTFQNELVMLDVVVNAPKEVHGVLAKHEVVLRPLKVFLDHVRAEVPERKFKLRLACEEVTVVGKPPRARTRDEVWKAFKLAIESTGQPSLYASFAKLRSLSTDA